MRIISLVTMNDARWRLEPACTNTTLRDFHQAQSTLPGGFWKRRFISTVRCSIYTITTTAHFDNAPLQAREMALRFRVDRKYFKNRTFGKWRSHNDQVISLPEDSSFNTNPKWTMTKLCFQISPSKKTFSSGDGKHLMTFLIYAAYCGRSVIWIL